MFPGRDIKSQSRTCDILLPTLAMRQVTLFSARLPAWGHLAPRVWQPYDEHVGFPKSWHGSRGGWRQKVKPGVELKGIY